MFSLAFFNNYQVGDTCGFKKAYSFIKVYKI